MTSENQAAQAESKAKVELTIDGIKEDLKNGIDRPGIQKKYGLRRVDVIRLFQHPELKGAKVHRPRPASSKSKATIGFVLKDAEGNDVTSTVFPAAKGTVENVPATDATAPQANVAEVPQPVQEEAAGW